MECSSTDGEKAGEGVLFIALFSADAWCENIKLISAPE